MKPNPLFYCFVHFCVAFFFLSVCVHVKSSRSFTFCLSRTCCWELEERRLGSIFLWESWRVPEGSAESWCCCQTEDGSDVGLIRLQRTESFCLIVYCCTRLNTGGGVGMCFPAFFLLWEIKLFTRSHFGHVKQLNLIYIHKSWSFIKIH